MFSLVRTVPDIRLASAPSGHAVSAACPYPCAARRGVGSSSSGAERPRLLDAREPIPTTSGWALGLRGGRGAGALGEARIPAPWSRSRMERCFRMILGYESPRVHVSEYAAKL
jgi:hypothetical protein